MHTTVTTAEMHNEPCPSYTVSKLLKGSFGEYRESTREGDLAGFCKTRSDKCHILFSYAKTERSVRILRSEVAGFGGLSKVRL
jgi:hypothetical protein